MDLGVVSFDFAESGPGRVAAYVPAVSEGGVAQRWQPADEEGSLAASVRASRKGDAAAAPPRVCALRNRKPQWDEQQQGHVLNFAGRVTESSVKNFQLEDRDDPGRGVVLQFGRVGKSTFTMDFAYVLLSLLLPCTASHQLTPLASLRYPLCAAQAFAICLAVMDGKLSDTEGFDLAQRMGGGGGAGAFDGDANVDGDARGDAKETGASGSMTNSSKGGMLGGILPSKQYLKDKLKRVGR